jgi:hypothetical protein
MCESIYGNLSRSPVELDMWSGLRNREQTVLMVQLGRWRHLTASIRQDLNLHAIPAHLAMDGCYSLCAGYPFFSRFAFFFFLITSRRLSSNPSPCLNPSLCLVMTVDNLDITCSSFIFLFFDYFFVPFFFSSRCCQTWRSDMFCNIPKQI